MNLKKQLFDACRKGNLEEIKNLHRNGIDIHINNDYPLRLSAFNGHLDIVKYLINHGANIHADNDDALFCASLNNHLEIIIYLIKSGADIYSNNHAALRWSLTNKSKIISYLFSLYEDKKQAFEIIFNKIHTDNLSIAKDIIEQYDFKIDNKSLEIIKEKFPSIYDCIKLSKEIKLTQNNINLDIGQIE